MRGTLLRLREISFRKAIFLSILWHLFWFSSITVVRLPTKVQVPRFSDISFLGTLLDEPSFEVHVTQRPIARAQKMVFREVFTQPSFQTLLEEGADFFRGRLPYPERAWGIPGERLGLTKKNPDSLFKRGAQFEMENVLLEGPVASRVLYYRPPQPRLPRWIDPQKASSFKLRFWVSPRGKVVGIEKLTSSGEPTLDMIGMRHLRRWQFNPKRDGQAEWGTVTLRFPLIEVEPK